MSVVLISFLLAMMSVPELYWASMKYLIAKERMMKKKKYLAWWVTKTFRVYMR